MGRISAITSLILSFFPPSLALAYPAVGDRVEYVGNIQHPDKTLIPYKKAVEIIGFNQRDQHWVMMEEETIGRIKQVKANSEHAKNMFTRIRFQSIMEDCVKYGGDLESLLVPAGTFPTCKFTEEVRGEGRIEKEEKWYADVPFGVAKTVDTENGVTKIYQLQSYSFGL